MLPAVLRWAEAMLTGEAAGTGLLSDAERPAEARSSVFTSDTERVASPAGDSRDPACVLF